MSRRLFVLFTSTLASLLVSHTARAGINFEAGQVTDAAQKPVYMVSGDLDGDHRADLVIVSPNSNEVGIYLAADTPSFLAAPRTMQFGSSLQRPAIGDLNNDGQLDLAVPDKAEATVWILLGQGDGTFKAPYKVALSSAVEKFRAPSAVAIVNFDSAGGADLAVADSRGDNVFILLNEGGPSPSFNGGREVFDVGPQPVDIRSADFNRDGKPDLVTLNVGGPQVKELDILLTTRIMQGFPDFSVHKYTIGRDPSNMVVADFNNDGNPDIAMLNNPTLRTSEVALLLDRDDGSLAPIATMPIGCPFFVGAETCKALTMAAGDFDGNQSIDLMVAMVDPRTTSAGNNGSDAMQAFGGLNDGSFIPGPVFATKKGPLSMTAADLNDDGLADVAVANDRTLNLQAFLSNSTTGGKGNGDDCKLGDECLSLRCTDGVCCAAQCAADEVCNVPGREGSCLPKAPTPVPCTLPDATQCTNGEFCVDGFCCDQSCENGRCNTPGFIGICIPLIPDGGTCTKGTDCVSTFCSDNNVCCREACPGGFCDDTGVCHALSTNGTDCNVDAECKSNVCDAIDGICCNRKCTSSEVCFPVQGMCRPLDYTPGPGTPGSQTETPTATQTGTPTATPRSTPGGNGERCAFPSDCANGFCVDGVCCQTNACGQDQHCELGTGMCVNNPPPTNTPTVTPVIPTPNPCGGCPDGSACQIVNGAPLCIHTSTSSGCSTVGDQPARGNLAVVAVLPLALWISRRWQLRRARARNR